MEQTKAPGKTLSPKEAVKSPKEVGSNNNPNAIFISMALDMTWRLALVVLVPVVGGFELDKYLKTTPLLTVLGFIIAMIGMALVLWRTLQVANRAAVSNKEKHS